MRIGKKTESVRDVSNPAPGAKVPEEFKRYFWDVVFDDLSTEKHPKFIAERLLNYGDLNAIKWLFSWTDRKFILKLVENSRNLNPKSRNYWKIMLTEINEDKNTINGSLNDVRISFFGYKYKIIDDFKIYKNIRLSGLKDIAAMKLEAIAGRGSKKDFVDMFFLLQKFTLPEIFSLHSEKYGTGLSNQYHHLKSLVYFADADEEAMPVMLKPLRWNDVKKHIISSARKFRI